MIYKFLPDILRSKVENKADDNTKTLTSFYEFLTEAPANFSIVNNEFMFYMPLEVQTYEYTCIDWNSTGDCLEMDQTELSQKSSSLCNDQKFCASELVSDYEPVYYYVSVGNFFETDTIPELELTSVPQATSYIVQNLANVIREYWVKINLTATTDSVKRIELVLDKDTLFVDELGEALFNNLSDLTGNITITKEHEIRPLYELAKLFDELYTQLLKGDFRPVYTVKLLLSEQLTAIPMYLATDILSVMNQLQQRIAIHNIRFADQFVSWEPLTLAIQQESGIMAILLKKLQEQGYTFEQFLEMQIEDRQTRLTNEV